MTPDFSELIERLRYSSHLSRLLGQSGEIYELIDEAATALQSITTTIAGLEVDAGRYRKIRAASTYRYDCGSLVLSFDQWIEVDAAMPTDPDGDEPTPPDAFDAAIDRARG